MTLLLLVEGVTGSVLAFEGPIGLWLDPPPARAAGERAKPPLDFATLATIAERLEPAAQVAYFASTGPDVAVLRIVPRRDPSTGSHAAVRYTHVLLDTHTGRDLGRYPDERPERALGSRVLPFVKDLHYNLAAGAPGTWVLFFLALTWTIDCLVGFVLTLPITARHFWARWRPAWKVKRGVGAYRVSFDLHRAGGLWFLAALFVFAWSSVQLEDHWDTYDTVMSKVFDYDRSVATYAAWPQHDATPLRLDWPAAQRRGEELMAAAAARQGFRILAPANIVNFPENGIYNYEAATDRGFPHAVREVVWFDGDTGAQLLLPGTIGRTGNVVSDWFRALHMAVDPVDYLVYRIFVCAFGILLSVLSVAGVYIWWKKRKGRQARRRGVDDVLPA